MVVERARPRKGAGTVDVYSDFYAKSSKLLNTGFFDVWFREGLVRDEE